MEGIKSVRRERGERDFCSWGVEGGSEREREGGRGGGGLWIKRGMESGGFVEGLGVGFG